MTVDKEHFKEINRAFAERGLPVMWPTDWEGIDALGDEFNDMVGNEFSPLDDNNPIAQRLASWWVAKHVTNGDGQRKIDTRFCPEYDDADIATMSRLLRVSVPQPCAVSAYRTPANDKEAAKRILPLDDPHAMCFANLTLDCDGLNPCEHLAVKRGEFLCVLTICAPCLKAVDTLDPDSDESRRS